MEVDEIRAPPASSSKTHRFSVSSQPAGGEGKKENDRKRMTVLIYDVIKSSTNGVSISSATNAEENQTDLWD